MGLRELTALRNLLHVPSFFLLNPSGYLDLQISYPTAFDKRSKTRYSGDDVNSTQVIAISSHNPKRAARIISLCF